ncbi:hypothetical protein PanWU01x14_020140 [Parasponia andersonii]|uniref:Disease resistance N-terminal domain-containing protein n=1 Tax=Parasponia andersonii TaxID=3476 RepID=A0A2P5DYN4_PARAD|nr:hypothetical protein PanWU01x14_020140 [Parasponia andersonii]
MVTASYLLFDLMIYFHLMLAEDEMAETFLSRVVKRLVDLLAEQVDLLRGVHGVVNSLKDELKIKQPFPKDAEAKPDTVSNVGASHVDPQLS